MQKSVIESFPQADISVSIVWIDMLHEDSQTAAQESALILQDPRVRHFHDPQKRSGKVIAQSMGGSGGVAWDIYLFFAPDGEWVKDPPKPTEWMHQLYPSWADLAHLRVGDDLVLELRKTMERLTASSS